MNDYSKMKWYSSLADAKAAYYEYLDNHHDAIVKAFNKYGSAFADSLGVDVTKLKGLIDIHDQSKRENEDEINGFIAHFYPYTGDDIGPDSYGLRRSVFEKGLLHHYHRNPHHPEYWVFIRVDNNKMDTKPMDAVYICEMVLDWIAHEARDKAPVDEYWKMNRAIKYFHPRTIKLIDILIDTVNDIRMKEAKENEENITAGE